MKISNIMASFSLSTIPTASAATTNKTNFLRRSVKPHAKKTRRCKVQCNAAEDGNNNNTSSETPKLLQPETSPDMQNIDRRNLLLGLGGLYAAANLTTLSSALAIPDSAPSNILDSAATNSGKDNRDGTDTNDLKHEHKSPEIPWAGNRSTPSAKGARLIPAESVGTVKKVEDVEFPVKVDHTMKVLVKRPAVTRSKAEKEKATEVLMVNGIRFDGEKFVKFDVFVNDKDNVPPSTAADSEFVGSFAQLPHNRSSEKMMMISGARFGMTELLEDLRAEDDEYVVVSLVPRTGCDDVTVSEIKIELVPIV